MFHRFFKRGKYSFQRLLPGWNAVLNLVLIQPLENIAAQTQPRGVRIVDVHHFAPRLHRKTKAGFLIPRDGRYLQCSAAIRIKNRAAEQKTEWYVSIGQAMKVFCRGHIEIEGAGYGKVNRGTVLKRGSDNAGVSPEHGFQSLTPAFGVAKEIAQLLLIFGTILPLCDLKLNLAA